MKSWLNKNSKWLGALGAIAAIIATVGMLIPEHNQNTSDQQIDIDGANNEATQIQEKQGGNQTATVRGEGHTAKQKQ